MPLLSGKPIAARILDETARQIQDHGIRPGLAVILVGSDAGSEIYVRLKGEAARKIGMRFELHSMPETASESEVGDLIRKLNLDPLIHGIILQLPLPSGWNADALISMIAPEKDADGFHPRVLERYLGGEESAMPVLPRAIRELILIPGISLAGEPALALVNSDLFGRVIKHMLGNLGLSATVLTREQLASHMHQLPAARVIVSVCGEPGLVRLRDLSPEGIVIDAGITRVGSRVLGDVAGDIGAYPGWVTPIPGGVGPLTIACLLRRTTELALLRRLS